MVRERKEKKEIEKLTWFVVCRNCRMRWRMQSISLFSLTFCDILSNTIDQCTNLGSLGLALSRRRISLRPHPTRHERDTVTRVHCLNSRWRWIEANSGMNNENAVVNGCGRTIASCTYIFSYDCDAHSHFAGSFTAPCQLIQLFPITFGRFM